MALLGALTSWWQRGRTPVVTPREASTAPPRAVAVTITASAVDRNWASALIELAYEGQPTPLSSEATASIRETVEKTLVRFAETPQRLPRRPQLLPQLLSTLNDDEASGREIAGVIARDPALAAHLLRLANSALYRTQPAPIENLDRAVALVGTEGLRQLVAMAVMQPVMRMEGGALGALPDLIWDHTQRTALAAAQFAKTVEREDAFAAQLLALLQGLGAILVAQALRDACAQHGGLPDAGSAAHLLQDASPRLGRAVARAWGLSERLLQGLDDQAIDDTAHMTGLGRALAAAAPHASAAMASARIADAA
ncbi:MAG TPA: HDOD domain-containing protein [Pseudoxanthomonas sp.]